MEVIPLPPFIQSHEPIALYKIIERRKLFNLQQFLRLPENRSEAGLVYYLVFNVFN